jgi:hypothetical protein
MTGPTERTPIRRLIGISVSEPDPDELILLGLSELHVRHAFIEVARHLLAGGYSIAYGGDFRPAGYTEAMVDLVRTYNKSDVAGPERVVVYIAWPRTNDLRASDRAELHRIATLIEVDAPMGAPERLPAPDQRSPVDLVWAALGLRAMRERMNSDIDARIVLGGRTYGQEGLAPGVIEEAHLAVRDGLPMYVVGGFGGAAATVAAALLGRRPEQLTTQYQMQSTSRYNELLNGAQQLGGLPALEAIGDDLRSSGLQTLHNGLDELDNARLAETDDLDEVISMVLRGLSRLFR